MKIATLCFSISVVLGVKGQTVKNNLLAFEMYVQESGLYSLTKNKISEKLDTVGRSLVLIPTLYSDSSMIGIIDPDDLRYRFDSISDTAPYKRIGFVIYDKVEFYLGAYYYKHDNTFVDILMDKYQFGEMNQNKNNLPFSFEELVEIEIKGGSIFYCHLTIGLFYFLPAAPECIFRKTKYLDLAEGICK